MAVSGFIFNNCNYTSDNIKLNLKYVSYLELLQAL